MAKTKTEKVIEFLIAKGAKELPSVSDKYRKFSHPTSPDHFYYVGKAGGVRVGKTHSDSLSVTEGIERQMKAKGIEAAKTG